MMTPNVGLLHATGHQHVWYRTFNHIFGSTLNIAINQVFFPAKRFAISNKGTEARNKIHDDIVYGEGNKGSTELK